MCIIVKQILFIKFDVQCGQYFANRHLRQFPRKFPESRKIGNSDENATRQFPIIRDNDFRRRSSQSRQSRNCEKLARILLSHSLNGPFLLAQRATIVLLDPERHAAVVKRVVALAPDDHTVLSTVDLLLTFRLASQTSIWNNWQLVLAYSEIAETHSAWEHFLRRLVFSSRRSSGRSLRSVLSFHPYPLFSVAI